jgi:hypothetical protein
MEKTSWMMGVMAMLFLQLVTVKSEDVDPICLDAYRLQCYDHYPHFNDCCDSDKCEGGSNALQCHWQYDMPCCSDSLIKGTVEIGSGEDGEACKKACELLGDKDNKYADYCPGGPLETKIGDTCLDAKLNLKSAQGAHGTKDWCEGKREYTCAWNYSAYLRDEKEFKGIQDEFKYNDADDTRGACRTACWALGNISNAAQDYCGGLLDELKGCPAAAESLKRSAPVWCRSDSMTLTEKPERRTAHNLVTPVNLSTFTGSTWSTCDEAWKKKCYNYPPFKKCCGNTCENGGSTFTCSWHVEYNKQTMSDTYHDSACTGVCLLIKAMEHDPFKLCNLQMEDVQECPKAQLKLDTYTSVPWCAKQSLSTVQGAPSFGIATTLAAAAAILTLVVAVHVAVRSRSQSQMSGDGYQRAPDQPRTEGGIA